MENLKQYAYKNMNELVPADELATAGLSRPLASLQVGPFNDPDLDHLQHIEFQVAQQGILFALCMLV